jgi:hypothetical protein
VVEVVLQLVERHLDGELDTGGAQFFNVGLHCEVAPEKFSRPTLLARPGMADRTWLGRQV